MKTNIVNRTVSFGTMKTDDLIEAFLEELDYLDPDKARKFRKELEDTEPESDDEHYILEDMFDALNECAPEFCYFGSHEGDASDYGFWSSWEAIEDTVNEGEAEYIDIDELRDKPVKSDFAVVVDGDNVVACITRDRKLVWRSMWTDKETLERIKRLEA